MKVATYNVNGVNGRLPRLLEWLEASAPDVVCLQELKTSDSKFPIRAIEQAGYGAVWHGQRAHHGVAVLARGVTPVERRRGLPGADNDQHSRYLEVDVHDLIVGSVYLPNGNPVGSPNFSYKLQWFERLISYAGSLCDLDRGVVLAGDFNVVPTDNDIYNAWWWREDAVMQPEAREAYQRLLAQGWADSTRLLHPFKRIYTFWTTANAFQRNAGFRMDFLLINPALRPRLETAEVDAAYRGGDRPSDHAPAWIVINATGSAM